ncbi:DUF2865 domain-containing protein [Aminobacter sp. HY435]|uniref:DUF2865 domain-containing protein n=1 Tax=Aminobacter sp. HY435 TaxID=2970917 RepID=UPI0022B9AB33|nr:DUF2865 domain-containing protein [Aminobacter sp. HY435]
MLPNDYAAAADIQQDQIDLARIRAADLGCGRAISGATIVACAELNARIAEMEDNLGSLASGPAPRPNKNTRRERIRIFDAMERAGCNNHEPEDEVAAAPVPDGQTTIIRGGSAEELSYNEEYPQHIIVGPGAGHGTGEYRTLCVRTCDGFAFPMSNAASMADFQRDQKNCEASCPGTEIELFYHLADGEPQENMVSARSGAPYRELATAYRYRRVDLPRVPACGCNIAASRNYSIIGGDGRPVAPPKAQPKVEAPAAPAPPPAPAPDRKVRAVGPAFLPDPQAAIDLQAPAPTQGR